MANERRNEMGKEAKTIGKVASGRDMLAEIRKSVAAVILGVDDEEMMKKARLVGY